VLRDATVQVRIEGHTDSLPISTVRYRSNWELSAARATAVLSHLVDDGVPASRLSIAGFADTRPVADNQTAEGRALNRRVDLVVLGDVRQDGQD
jgi:chemotaxis protein MotB